MSSVPNLRCGILLPHFGSHASRKSLIDTAQQAERLGFDSLWVRDHIVYRPHEYEDPSPIHFDPFVSLSAVASVTFQIGLGIAVLIPHRHPIHTAVLLGSLAAIAGEGRVVAGWGVGNFDHEFDAIGASQLDRRILVREQVEVVRKLLTGVPVTHQGDDYSFHDVLISPTPRAGQDIPMWYGGGSKAAVRRAAEYCDGWMASRMPHYHFRQLIDRMKRIAEQNRRPVPVVAHIPHVVPADSPAEAEKYLNMPSLVEACRKAFQPAPGQSFDSLEDIDGAVLAGTSDDIVEGALRLLESGAEHLIFDLRPMFGRISECVQLLGEEVLPRLRASS